jgi:hypothetical protein
MDMDMRAFPIRELDHRLARADAMASLAERDPQNESATRGWHNRLAGFLRPFANCASLLVWP